MRNALLLCTLLLLVVCGPRCSESHAHAPTDQPKNPDAEKLARAIVSAICTDNYSAFTDLLVTTHDYVTMRRSSSDPYDQLSANDSVQGMYNIHKHARSSFDRIRKEGTRDGIAWDKTQYKYCTFLADTVNGVEIIRMKIVMTFREVEYPITALEVIKTPAGWKIYGHLAYGDHLMYIEQIEQLRIAQAMMDSIAKADSMMAAIEWQKAYRIADSMQKADSIAAANQNKKKGKKKR